MTESDEANRDRRPHVAVVIVSFKSANDLSICFEALARQSHPDFEVVVCENGGAEAFRRLSLALPTALPGGRSVRLIEAPGNLGYAGGVNVGLRATREADAWWILNPDTQPAPDALAALVERLHAGGCDAVGGPVLTFDGEVITYGGAWNSWLARTTSLRDENSGSGAIEGRLDYLCGASMLVGRRFLDVAGPLREDYFLYCEEVEWCLRAVQRGARLGFARGGRVYHLQGASTGNVLTVADRPRLPVYLDARNKVLLTIDHYAAKAPIAIAAALLLLVARYARRKAWRQLRDGVDGWRAGLRNERGIPAWLERGPQAPAWRTAQPPLEMSLWRSRRE